MAVATPVATFTIKPDPFDFTKPPRMEKGIRHFEHFRLASNLNNSDADNVLRGLKLMSVQCQRYNAIKTVFLKHF